MMCVYLCSHVVTFLSFTFQYRLGTGYHPAARHSNITDVPLKANLSSPKTLTMPFSASRRKYIKKLEFCAFHFFKCLHVRVNHACIFLWMHVCTFNRFLSSVTFEIHVAACMYVYLSVAWWMLFFIPLHFPPWHQISYLRPLRDTVSHLWGLLSGSLKAGGGNRQLL